MSLASLLEVINLRLNLLRDDLYEKLENISLTPGEKGEKGDKGEQGAKGDKGDMGPPGIDGAKGKDGKDGKDGQDGISVTGAAVDFDNHLTITLSDGSEIDAGEIKVDAEGIVQHYSTVVKPGDDVNPDETKLIDTTNFGQYKYVGYAPAGTAENKARWKIKRIEFITDGQGNDDYEIKWAEGSAAYDKTWNNHISYNYS